MINDLLADRKQWPANGHKARLTKDGYVVDTRIKMVKIKAKKNVTTDPVAEIKKEMEEMKKRMQEEIDSLRELAGGGEGGGG
eukprot:gene24990-41353_t